MAKVKLKQVEEYESSSAHSSSSGDIQVSTKEEVVGIIPKEETNVLKIYPTTYETCNYVYDDLGIPHFEEEKYKIASEHAKTEGRIPWDAIDFSYVIEDRDTKSLFWGILANDIKVAPKLINTESVESLASFFRMNKELIEVQPFGNLKNCCCFTSMFEDCEKLSTIPDFPQVCDGVVCDRMFYNCYALKAAPAIHGRIGEATSMFYNCRSLETVPEYDLSKCESMSSMFCNCESLAGEFPWEIDLSSIYFVNSLSSMFKGTKVTKATFKNVPKDFTMEAIASSISDNSIEVVIKNVLE
jgi:hypothetical protein